MIDITEIAAGVIDPGTAKDALQKIMSKMNDIADTTALAEEASKGKSTIDEIGDYYAQLKEAYDEVTEHISFVTGVIEVIPKITSFLV